MTDPTATAAPEKAAYRTALVPFGTALSDEGYSMVEAIERHVCRDPWKSHPNHCGHCYYPWPCPTVALYRAVMRAVAVDPEDHATTSRDYGRGFAEAVRLIREAISDGDRAQPATSTIGQERS